MSAPPPFLLHGDPVAVVVPSSPADPDALATGLEILAGWGVAPEIVDLGPADLQRRSSLARALDPAAGFRAVLCCRGGYGAMRLLEGVAWRPDLEPRPSDDQGLWFIGSSDATALLVARGQSGLSGCVYGPMPATPAFQAENGRNAEGLRRILMGERPSIRLEGRTVCSGVARGPLVGGCLALLAATLGTPLAADLAGAVLLLEDVAEAPYRLDRMLTSMRLAGAFHGVQAIAVGALHECGLDPGAEEALLRDRLGDLGVPVICGLAFGHGPHQTPLLLHGPAATISAHATGASLEQVIEASG